MSEILGAVVPSTLSAARLALHHAAQLAAAPASTLLEKAPDDSQAASFRLAGQTRAAALTWLGEQFGQAVVLPTHEVPPHEVTQGAQFPTPDAAFAELWRWFGFAATALERFRGTAASASPVRCWPHHFDIATLVSFPGGSEPRSIGLGLSPGDGGYDEPYWYVTPWPYPKPERWPELPGGAQWNKTGWVGAVLRGTRLVESTSAEAQARAVDTYLVESFAACRTLLGV